MSQRISQEGLCHSDGSGGSPQSLSFLTKTSILVSLQSILQLWKDERASFVLRIEKERFNNMFNYVI